MMNLQRRCPEHLSVPKCSISLDASERTVEEGLWHVICLSIRCGLLEQEAAGSKGAAMYTQTTETQIESTRYFGSVADDPPAGDETILFVEDEAFVREVTCEVLRSAGYHVLSAKNALEAMQLFQARHGEVELLLTDVVLPGESGRTLAGRLRRENPELKVLLSTGYAEQMGREEPMQAEILAKPFSTEVLLRRVRRMLDREQDLTREDLLTHACGSA